MKGLLKINGKESFPEWCLLDCEANVIIRIYLKVKKLWKVKTSWRNVLSLSCGLATRWGLCWFGIEREKEREREREQKRKQRNWRERERVSKREKLGCASVYGCACKRMRKRASDWTREVCVCEGVCVCVCKRIRDVWVCALALKGERRFKMREKENLR